MIKKNNCHKLAVKRNFIHYDDNKKVTTEKNWQPKQMTSYQAHAWLYTNPSTQIETEQSEKRN